MATASKWSNVSVAIESALGGNLTISGITKANPGVVTSTAHGLTNGDYVKLSVQGMHQLDGRVVRVAGVATDTFQLEGVDTTSFDTFSSGTANEVTFGTSLATATSVSASGGDFDYIDVTTIHDNVRKQLPGLANAATYSFENIWDPSDAGLIALKSASDSQAQKAIRFTFGTGGRIMVFNGYIGASLLPTGNAQEVVKTSVTITGYGKPTVYAS